MKIARAIPYVLAGLLVDTGDSGHWVWFSVLGAMGLVACLYWFRRNRERDSV